MAQIIKSLSLDVSRQNRVRAILAKQFDNDSRFLKIQLNNEGEPIAVASTSMVLINATRADGESESFTGCVNDDGSVTVPITYWMLEVPGRVKCDISVISEQGSKLSSLSFSIEVEKTNGVGESVDEQQNGGILVQLIAEVKAFNEQVGRMNSRLTSLEQSGLGGASVQSDYAQNDDTQSDYIKNRPFYESEPTVAELMSSAVRTLTWDGDFWSINLELTEEQAALWNGKWSAATVRWRGVEYVCEPFELDGVKALGNFGIVLGSPSEEPFIIVVIDNMITFMDVGTAPPEDTSFENTVECEFGVSAEVSEVHTLDPKFIESVAWEKVSGKPFCVYPYGTVMAEGVANCIMPYGGEVLYVDFGEPFDIVDGAVYVVTFDGVEYSVVGNDGAIFYQGDGGVSFGFSADGTVSASAQGQHAYKVVAGTEITKKLDSRFIPDAAQPTSIDLSGFDTNGTIVETYADGTSKTTTVEFDTSGNPTKITDADGNVTMLMW